MSSKVICLNKTAYDTSAPVPEVVSLLKNMLARAESGELRNVAVIGLDGNGDAIHGRVLNGSRFGFVGALRFLQYDVERGWDGADS